MLRSADEGKLLRMILSAIGQEVRENSDISQSLCNEDDEVLDQLRSSIQETQDEIADKKAKISQQKKLVQNKITAKNIARHEEALQTLEQRLKEDQDELDSFKDIDTKDSLATQQKELLKSLFYVVNTRI